jgi:hypothetical protein
MKEKWLQFEAMLATMNDDDVRAAAERVVGLATGRIPSSNAEQLAAIRLFFDAIDMICEREAEE